MQLPWNVPDWSWWKPWEWPQHVLGWLRNWSEYREAVHRARKAKFEADYAEAAQSNPLWETRVAEMIRKLRRHYNEAEAKYPGENVVPIIKPSPEDDVEVFNEAMRRIKNEAQSTTRRYRG